MKKLINTRRTTNGRPYRKDLSVTFGATSPARRGNKGGFTIVELVVAMVIIVLVSGAGISLVMTQTKVDSQATQTVEATNICENAIECFRYAVNNQGEKGIEETFKEAFNMTLADDEKLGDPDAETGKYTINKSGAEITIEIDGNTIKIYAVDSFGIVIFDDSYTK